MPLHCISPAIQIAHHHRVSRPCLEPFAGDRVIELHYDPSRLFPWSLVNAVKGASTLSTRIIPSYLAHRAERTTNRLSFGINRLSAGQNLLGPAAVYLARELCPLCHSPQIFPIFRHCKACLSCIAVQASVQCFADRLFSARANKSHQSCIVLEKLSRGRSNTTESSIRENPSFSFPPI